MNSEVCAPSWPSCDHDRSRHQAQGAGQVVAQRQIERPEDAGGLAGLRLRRGGSGGRDHDGFAHPLGFEHHVALDRVEPPGIEAGRLQLAEALGRDDQKETALDAGDESESCRRPWRRRRRRLCRR